MVGFRPILAGLLLSEALVLAVIGEDKTPVQHATLHARIARQVVDLRALVVRFVRATPGAGHDSSRKIEVVKKNTIVRFRAFVPSTIDRQ